MLMMAETLPIDIEILGASDNALQVIPAELRHLDGEGAVLVVPENKAKRLHWGARVRFEIGDNPTVYEIVGTVVAYEPQEDTGEIEIILRLWECRPVSQMRSTPRRRSRFSVSVCAAGSSVPMVGQCLDIGGGGMRLRVPALDPMPVHLMLQFGLPPESAAILELQGRIIRAVPCERGEGHMEVALCFERLTVSQGMAIAQFLSV